MVSATMPRRFNMIKLTKTKLLASLVLAILFSITCGDTDTAKAPAISAEEQYAFTYKTQVSQMFPNSGGDVESYKLISGTLPTGLELAVTGGQLVLSGTPTKVTLNETKAQIASVPLEIEITNKGGSSRVTLNVTINPIFKSGDQSMGILHDNRTGVTTFDSLNGITDCNGSECATNEHIHMTALTHVHMSDLTNMHTHDNPYPYGGGGSVNPALGNNDGSTKHSHNNMTHVHTNNNNNSNLIHTANDISFASGGTGSVTDPVLIGVASNATNLSFVVDFAGVTIPNFDATNDINNPGNDSFYIKLIGIPIDATIHNFVMEYIKLFTLNNEVNITFLPLIDGNAPLTFQSGADFEGSFSIKRGGSLVGSKPVLLEILQRKAGTGVVATLEGQIRFTIEITPPA